MSDGPADAYYSETHDDGECFYAKRGKTMVKIVDYSPSGGGHTLYPLVAEEGAIEDARERDWNFEELSWGAIPEPVQDHFRDVFPDFSDGVPRYDLQQEASALFSDAESAVDSAIMLGREQERRKTRELLDELEAKMGDEDMTGATREQVLAAAFHRIREKLPDPERDGGTYDN